MNNHSGNHSECYIDILYITYNALFPYSMCIVYRWCLKTFYANCSDHNDRFLDQQTGMQTISNLLFTMFVQILQLCIKMYTVENNCRDIRLHKNKNI